MNPRDDIWLFPCPVLNQAGEPNHGLVAVFTPVMPGTNMRFLAGFSGPYTPPPKPEPPNDGGSPNVIDLAAYRARRRADQAPVEANSNVIPFRRAA